MEHHRFYNSEDSADKKVWFTSCVDLSDGTGPLWTFQESNLNHLFAPLAAYDWKSIVTYWMWWSRLLLYSCSTTKSHPVKKPFLYLCQITAFPHATPLIQHNPLEDFAHTTLPNLSLLTSLSLTQSSNHSIFHRPGELEPLNLASC